MDCKKEPYEFSPPGDKYLVVIEGANHLSFGGGLGPRGAAITDVVKLGSRRFWDAWLKTSQPARDYLRSDRMIEVSGGSCTFDRT